MQLFVYKLGETLFEGETQGVNLPSETGEIGILPHHVPLVTVLTPGSISIQTPENKKEVQISGGFAYTDGTRLVVLAD